MTSETAKICAVHVIITGHVQGVWFRGWTESQAKQFGVAGWVRNRRDGTVEAIFSGQAAAVDAILRACSVGPPEADVTKIIKFPVAIPRTQRFSVLATK